MRYGVIDLGSNTVRMTCFDETSVGLRRILNEKELVGLVGYIESGRLTQEGMIRLTETIASFGDTARAIGVDVLGCFATAGLRSIRNTDDVIEQVEQQANVRIHLISGEEEARLDFLGSARPKNVEEGLVTDMGGASTELVRYRGDSIENMISLPFGSLMLYKRYVSGILPDAGELKHIRRFVKKEFGTVEWLAPSANLCLIGGTARAVARLHREIFGRERESLQGYQFDAEDICRLLKMSAEHRKAAAREILRISPERIHTIMPGLVAMCELVELAECKRVTISESGVREGYLDEYLHKRQLSF